MLFNSFYCAARGELEDLVLASSNVYVSDVTPTQQGPAYAKLHVKSSSFVCTRRKLLPNFLCLGEAAVGRRPVANAIGIGLPAYPARDKGLARAEWCCLSLYDRNPTLSFSIPDYNALYLRR